ncbi:butyrate kinase [Alkalibacter rhizosphaerae]|uniref:Probable butyrate kinase n=1 Tax=Alkalibacter rhizosphaerae TaxID=2815577 RepID=A0A974XMB4_9FIRM|nr:butyrate kinase [Alkalibacter rhizosphaerae]QSX08551.1 butyrate kinase [Alkalibacter rhizosphaerae]
MSYKIFVINPGSTSTRVALYLDEKQLFYHKIDHDTEVLSKFKNTMEQYVMRKDAVETLLKENIVSLDELSAVVGRGGMLQTIRPGAYYVNEKMLRELEENPYMEHASNLGAKIAYGITKPLGIPAFIYDSPRADVLTEIARISGLANFPRTATSHVLNSRATAMKAAEQIGKLYEEVNLVVAHLGGGISMSVHRKGQIVDILSDDEGPFSPECSGKFPARELIRLCYSGIHTEKEMQRLLRGNGGLKSYFNTIDLREVESWMEEGDGEASLVFQALGYQIAKGIGELSTVVAGKVDGIVLTGGMARSEALTRLVEERVKFIAPVIIFPGQLEMEALAGGALRILEGKEEVQNFEI